MILFNINEGGLTNINVSEGGLIVLANISDNF